MARILFVDDEPNIRLFYTGVLADAGHDVLEAASSRETMLSIQRSRPDLVILDIKLGAESGLDVLQQIVHFHPGLPVIILSAYASFQDDYTSWLAEGYVVKSGDPSEFLRAVDGTCRRLMLTGEQSSVSLASAYESSGDRHHPAVDSGNRVAQAGHLHRGA
jgi:DNA-binding response OmpR family regulator